MFSHARVMVTGVGSDLKTKLLVNASYHKWCIHKFEPKLPRRHGIHIMIPNSSVLALEWDWRSNSRTLLKSDCCFFSDLYRSLTNYFFNP